MSNVYSVGNNRQLIIYAAGSNIFLRIAHFGGLERPIVLATDYNHGLNECVYNDTLYYTYISTDNSLHIKNIMESQSIYTVSGNNIPELYNPSICVCNHSLLLFYLKNNPLLKHLCLHCLSFGDIHNCTEAFPVPLPSCVTDISDYHIFKAGNTLFLYVNNRMFFIEEIGHIKEMRLVSEIKENDNNKNKLAACQAKINEQTAVINSIRLQYDELMNVASQYREEALKWRSKFM